jgi:hypothetical protein
MTRFVPLALLAGCATLTTARPLEPGAHAVGVVFGGGVVNLGAPIPLPNLIVEGRHGVAAPGGHEIDVGWGANATSLAFGILSLHGGGAVLLADQAGARPALSLGNRLWFATNLPGLGSRVSPTPEVWAADQVELTASWLAGQHLPYVSVSQYFDFGNPALTLTPAVGAVWDFREPGGLALQTELRWFGVGVPDDGSEVSWIPGNTGIIGLDVGLSGRFGRRK